MDQAKVESFAKRATPWLSGGFLFTLGATVATYTAMGVVHRQGLDFRNLEITDGITMHDLWMVEGGALFLLGVAWMLAAGLSAENEKTA